MAGIHWGINYSRKSRRIGISSFGHVWAGNPEGFSISHERWHTWRLLASRQRVKGSWWLCCHEVALMGRLGELFYTNDGNNSVGKLSCDQQFEWRWYRDFDAVLNWADDFLDKKTGVSITSVFFFLAVKFLLLLRCCSLEVAWFRNP